MLEGELKVEYDTGDCMFIKLHGEAVDTPINLSTSLMEFKPTYSGLSTQLTVVMFNKSDIKVRTPLL
jgi:hypothetical protein